MTDERQTLELEQVERQILELALVSPKAAFMLLILEIERELRKLLASTGVLKRYLESPHQPLLWL